MMQRIVLYGGLLSNKMDNNKVPKQVGVYNRLHSTCLTYTAKLRYN